jgi:uncharacterized protein
MTYSLIVTLLILCPLVFLACFIDSIAGGGGIIALPAYLAAGLPIHTAYGTNKFVMCFGTSTAAVNYLRSGCVSLRLGIPAALCALVGAVLGARLALFLSPHALQVCLLIILPLVAVFMLLNRGFGAPVHQKMIKPEVAVVLAGAIGFVLGAYDGFFGPGCGMFLALAFVMIEHLDMIMATGTAKISNWASNVASAATFFLAGKIEFRIVLPCIFCAVCGNLLGSHLAIKKGSRFIKPVIAVVAVLLLVKIIVQFIQTN